MDFRKCYECVKEEVNLNLEPESGEDKLKSMVTTTLDLPVTMYGGEAFGRKFLILRDGGVVPVELVHEYTIHLGGYDTDADFIASGGVEGAIMQGDTLEIYAPRLSRINEQQRASIIALWKKYGLKKFYAMDIHGMAVLPIKSADQLDLVLQYGPEYARAPVEESKDHLTLDFGEGDKRETKGTWFRPTKSYYFLSRKNLGRNPTVTPQTSKDLFGGSYQGEPVTPRVCLGPTPDECLYAMSPTLGGYPEKFFVYQYDDDKELYRPVESELPDVQQTGEVWSLEPIKMKLVKEIKRIAGGEY